MRRITAIVVLLLVVGLPTIGQSIAAPTSDTSTTSGTPTVSTFNGYCFLGPYNTVIECPASPTPTRVPILPTKLLTVGGGLAMPAGTTQYDVTVTSQFVCFALNEPITVATLGNPNAAALTPLFPTIEPGGNNVTVNVQQNENQPGAGTARLLLEVFNAVVGPEGLDLKAVWTQEGVHRVVNVVSPAPPTATPTPLPGQPTATSTSTPVSTSSATPTATPTPVPSPFTVRACVQPNVLSGVSLAPHGSPFTLYGQTTPGAVCTASATDSTFVNPADAFGQVALSDGLVVFPMIEQSASDYGIASVTCTLNGQTQTAYTYFFILQTGQVRASQAAGCVPTSPTDTEAYATVSLLNPPEFSDETVSGCFFVNGQPVSGVPMVVVAHLTTGDVGCTSATDVSGGAQCIVNVDASQPDFPVGVSVYFVYKGVQYFVPAAFTPIKL